MLKESQSDLKSSMIVSNIFIEQLWDQCEDAESRNYLLLRLICTICENREKSLVLSILFKIISLNPKLGYDKKAEILNTIYLYDEIFSWMKKSCSFFSGALVDRLNLSQWLINHFTNWVNTVIISLLHCNCPAVSRRTRWFFEDLRSSHVSSLKTFNILPSHPFGIQRPESGPEVGSHHNNSYMKTGCWIVPQLDPEFIFSMSPPTPHKKFLTIRSPPRPLPGNFQAGSGWSATQLTPDIAENCRLYNLL